MRLAMMPDSSRTIGTVDVTVVVVTYNRAALLPRAIESLLRQRTGGRFELRIVAVDNASTDDTPRVLDELVRSAPPGKLRAVREERQGVAAARNRGIAEVASPWIAFFDDDMVAEPDWLAGLHAVARERGARCVGGRNVLELSPDELGALPELCRGLLGEKPEAASPRPYTDKSLPGAGNVLFDRRLFDELGGFDDVVGAGCEDTDVFRRIQRAGHAVWYAPGAVASHFVPRERLRPEYFEWVCLRHGASYALIENRQRGRAYAAASCAARLARAAVWNAPRLALSAARRAQADALAEKCMLWRTLGYARETLFLFAPSVFPQDAFFRRLDFRHTWR
jgi:GT2 family glycosyltransferase